MLSQVSSRSLKDQQTFPVQHICFEMTTKLGHVDVSPRTDYVHSSIYVREALGGCLEVAATFMFVGKCNFLIHYVKINLYVAPTSTSCKPSGQNREGLESTFPNTSIPRVDIGVTFSFA